MLNINNYFYINFILFLNFINVTSFDDYKKHKIVKRERAFNLLRLERALDDTGHVNDQFGKERTIRELNVPEDEDAKCQEKCNDELKLGLDMVKAHTSFGSIGVPSVVDELDLQMFCRIDFLHDNCLRNCGFEVQFNMRDYVCRKRYHDMIKNLACFNKASFSLKRHCGNKRCGPYSELQVTILGFAQRCRTLICDLSCSRGILVQECGRPSGNEAFKFLLDYTRTQITSWMKETAINTKRQISQIIPQSCSRMFCERFDYKNCTYIPAA